MSAAVSKSLDYLARDAARIHGEPGGKEEDRGTRDESGPLPLQKSPRMFSGDTALCA